MRPSKRLPFDILAEGSGEPVVLVHGSGSDRRTWDTQRPEFAEDFRVITYSRRYHWPNERASGGDEYSMVQHADDLGVLISSLGSGPVHLVGHSYGAIVSLMATMQRPASVRSLDLVEPPAIPATICRRPRRKRMVCMMVRKPRLALELIKFDARGMAPAVRAARRNKMDKAFVVFGRAALGRVSFEGLPLPRWEQAIVNNIRAEYIGSGLPPIQPEDLRRLQTRTLLVTGQYSRRLWRMLSKELNAQLPVSTMVAIPGAAHIVHEDSAVDFNREVLAFLRSTRER